MSNQVRFKCALRNRPQRRHREPSPAVAIIISAVVGAAVFVLFASYLPQ